MKIYRITAPDGRELEKTFQTKQEAARAMYLDIVDHQVDDYTPFDYHLKEEEVQGPESIITYITARNVLGSIELSKIAVDDDNKDTVATIDYLITMARAWNKADGFDPYADPRGSYHPNFKKSAPGLLALDITLKESADEFSFSSIISFRTEELARQFGLTFIDQFKQILFK